MSNPTCLDIIIFKQRNNLCYIVLFNHLNRNASQTYVSIRFEHIFEWFLKQTHPYSTPILSSCFLMLCNCSQRISVIHHCFLPHPLCHCRIIVVWGLRKIIPVKCVTVFVNALSVGGRQTENKITLGPYTVSVSGSVPNRACWPSPGWTAYEFALGNQSLSKHVVW